MTKIDTVQAGKDAIHEVIQRALAKRHAKDSDFICNIIDLANSAKTESVRLQANKDMAAYCQVQIVEKRDTTHHIDDNLVDAVLASRAKRKNGKQSR